MRNQINIGGLIKDELLRQERSFSWLARKLNCKRMTVYRIFNKNSIDTMLLARICNILDRNFFEVLAQEFDARNNSGKNPLS